jgi:cystathionine beta-lyase/cystathionine gamma-synthase
MSGTGSLFSVESQVPVAKLRLWADRLRYFRIGPSWGGFESLVTVNSATRLGGEPLALVRLYIGTEDPADLIRDLDDAWQSVAEEENASYG